jgi:hypothetical protein
LEDSYAAGLFDGEGFVRVAIWNKPNSPHVRYQVIAGLANTYRPVMEQIADQYGGSVYDVRHDLRNPKNRVVFNWQVGSQKAASFFRLVLPFLIIKKEQVELALKLQESIDSHKFRGSSERTAVLRQNVWDERDALANRIRELKKVSYAPFVDSGPIESVNGH